eukprot:SM000070S21337  [mRNA]  locus=s70:388294:391475:+ [translate_table: standard]
MAGTRGFEVHPDCAAHYPPPATQAVASAAGRDALRPRRRPSPACNEGIGAAALASGAPGGQCEDLRDGACIQNGIATEWQVRVSTGSQGVSQGLKKAEERLCLMSLTRGASYINIVELGRMGAAGALVLPGRRSARLNSLLNAGTAAGIRLPATGPVPFAESSECPVAQEKPHTAYKKETSQESWPEDSNGIEVPLKRGRSKGEKTLPTRDLEEKLWLLGHPRVAGVDEAGRGPLAGPVVAAACIIPSSVTIAGIDDSKNLSEERREELYELITGTPGVQYAIQAVDVPTIDKINILQAAMRAMAMAVKELDQNNEGKTCYVLVDGNRLPNEIPSSRAEPVIKGDGTCQVIAAASILAKVTRDRIMCQYDSKWPEYGFKNHKGYATAVHIAALQQHGPCDIHRRSFAPLKDWIKPGGGIKRFFAAQERGAGQQ